jgi:SAM-dependent methyltransferase
MDREPRGAGVAARVLWALGGGPGMAQPSRRLRRRLFLPGVGDVMRRLDLAALAEIRARHAPGLDDAALRATRAPVKYLDPARQVKRNLRRAAELELHGRPPLRILDLGCGAGYFLKICAILGHRATGLDLDENPIFREVVTALGVNRLIGRIDPLTPVPVAGGPFDLITAFAVCFNDHNGPEPWGPAGWRFFLDDAAGRLLAPRGRLLMKLNPRTEPPGEGACYTPELAEAFRTWGLRVTGPWVSLDRGAYRRGAAPRT